MNKKLFWYMGGELAGQSHPPYENLIGWYTGATYIESGSTFLSDLGPPSLGNYPMQLVQGPCLMFALADYGVCAGHGTLESYEGTAVAIYDNTNVTVTTAGTLYNLVFSDGTVMPCIGKTDTVNPVTIFGTLGESFEIVTLDIAAVWARSQNTYFFEIHGYWKDQNGRYPYPHDGATFVPKGFNYSINSFAFSTPGTAAPAEIVAMDLGIHMFTNTYGESVPVTQQHMNEYGKEEVVNGYFTNGSTGWALNTGITLVGQTISLDGTQWQSALTITSVFTPGEEYEVLIEVTDFVSVGDLRVRSNGDEMDKQTISANGIVKFTGTAAAAGSLYVQATTSGGVYALNWISARKKSPLVNNNGQYFFGAKTGSTQKELLLYESVLTGDDLFWALHYVGQAAIMTYNSQDMQFEGKDIYKRG